MANKKDKSSTQKSPQSPNSDKNKSEDAFLAGLEKAGFDDQVKEKLTKLKTQLDKFQKEVLSKFGEYILGISLLPPPLPQQTPPQPGLPPPITPEQPPQPSSEVSIFVLINDSDVKKMTRWELKDKLEKIIIKLAKEIDQNFQPEVMVLSELREACFDGKYELLAELSYAGILYDPKDLLQALKISEVHKSMVLKKFEKYVVSYVAVGSLFRGDARSADIDVAVIIDDTDVKKMSRIELRDKLGAIIRSMGYDASSLTGVKKSFHIQVYILTDFWESIKEANPVIFTFLRDGVPFYDRGVFMPWKLLLQMGRIRPSPEAIDMFMDMGDRLIDRAKGRMLSIIAEDIYYAVLNPSQAALMLYGLPPSTPRETIKLIRDIFVQKEKMLELKYANVLESIFKCYKDIEHGTINEIKGKELDKLMSDAEFYLKRISKLFQQIERRAEKQSIKEFTTSVERVIQDVLSLYKIQTKNIVSGFNQLVDKKICSKEQLKLVKEITKLHENQQKLTKQEVEKIRRDGNILLRHLMEHIQVKRIDDIKRTKMLIKYGEKFAEVYVLGEILMIVEDMQTEEKQRRVSKAPIHADGSVGSFVESSLAELEDALAKVKVPKQVMVPEKLIESLRSIYGNDVKIVLM